MPQSSEGLVQKAICVEWLVLNALSSPFSGRLGFLFICL